MMKLYLKKKKNSTTTYSIIRRRKNSFSSNPVKWSWYFSGLTRDQMMKIGSNKWHCNNRRHVWGMIPIIHLGIVPPPWRDPHKHTTCIPRWNDVEKTVSTSLQLGIHVVCLLRYRVILRRFCMDFRWISKLIHPRWVIFNDMKRIQNKTLS